MEIKILDKETGKNPIIQNQIYALFKQLSPNKRPLNFDEILHQNNQIVLIACFIADKVVGIASMANYSVISGKKGWIEDVVVSENYRGMGIGRTLIEKLLAIADEEYLTEVLLFTEDHRNAAIHLYESLNFKRKESNIFVLKK